MDVQQLHHDGVSISEIGRRLNLDRKTVRKYLKVAPHAYERQAKSWKIDPFRSYLRERWELGVQNAARLFAEIQKRGYGGCATQVKKVVRPWRSEGRERAFVRFETAPGEQAQMDWGHFGNWGGKRLYGFALTLCWSRMQYVEFTQRQDAETLLHCMVHALEFFKGVPQTVLTDNMKTVVLDRIDGQPRFHPKMLDFASYYGFVPRVCRPYRPETKGKIESTIRYIKGSFWPGIAFAPLEDLNRQALAWCGEANLRVHATTREVPLIRFPHEGLTELNGQPAYDTSYVSHRMVAKDCLVAYRGNRYSVPHAHAGRGVVVREPLGTGTIRIFYQQELIAEHRLSGKRGEMVIERSHYASLPRRSRVPVLYTPSPAVELPPGPESAATSSRPRSSSGHCRSTTRSVRRSPMSLQSERLLNHMLRLRLTHLPNCFEAIAEEASAKDLPYLDFLEQVLEAESQAKHSRNVRLKTQWAHFPYNKGLDQFDFAFQPSVDERKLRELASLAFLERKENVLLLGPPGVGKTHLGIALGTEAIVAGSSVYFVTMQDLVAQFQRARDENKLKERMSLLVKPKLLILDEMGYLTLDSFAATCLFQLVSERYEKGSIILTSNKSYGDWGSIFADNVIASAILDRLLHHSTTINIKGESYRLKDKKKAGLIAAKLPGKEA